MNDMRQMTERGRRIEDASFAIIDAEAGAHDFDARQWQVVRRVIHATADFELKALLRLSPDAIDAGVAALRRGAAVVCDVRMISAGLNQARLDAYGCATHCFIDDADVVARARAAGATRAEEAMREAWRRGLLDGAIVAVGNAPTALLELARLCRDEGVRPALVVGVPVGFVSAAESKEVAMALPAPSIVVRGRKGGSTIAVAILHALLLLSTEAAS